MLWCSFSNKIFIFESIGLYDDIYELLEECVIDGIKFKDIIMDDNTEILSKD